MKSSWMWNGIRLCLLTDKTLHPVTFYAIYFWRYFHKRKTF